MVLKFLELYFNYINIEIKTKIQDTIKKSIK